MLLWSSYLLSTESWLLILTVFFLVKYYFHRKWETLKRYGIPHDPPSFIRLGHARTVVSDGIFEFELEQKKKHGPIWGYYMMGQPRIVIHDPEILHQVCIKEFSTFPNRVQGGAPVQLNGTDMINGLLSATGAQWKRTRSTLSTAFSTAKIKQMVVLVERCAEHTLKTFRDKADNDEGHFVAKDVFGKLSLDVICYAAFSADLYSQDNSRDEPQILTNAKRYFHQRFFTFYYILAVNFPFIRSFLTRLSDHKPHVVFFKKLCDRLVDQREQGHAIHKGVDLMQLMIDTKISNVEVKNGARKGLTSSEIVGNAMTMLLAGYDTTSSAMTFLAYNLAVYPEVQRILQGEIDEMYNKHKIVDFEVISNLCFLDMCVNENLRLYCPVPRTVRSAKNEITLSGLTIPRQWRVVFPIHSMCHDPEFWDEPMEFRPERMRDLSKIHPMTFQPFGSGPRNCIGSKLAIMEIKLAFCKVLKLFNIEPAADTPKPPLKLTSGVTTSSTANFRLRVVPRTPHP